MPKTTQFEEEERLLRRAASRRDFAEAERSAARYRRLIDDLPASERLAHLAGGCELLAWAVRRLRIARAGLAEDLRRTKAAARYLAG
jgi:hypothetical protein